MAFKEGTLKSSGQDDDTWGVKTVIYDDGAMGFFDGLKGAIDETTPNNTLGITTPQQKLGLLYSRLNSNTAFKLTASDGAASDFFGFSVAAGSGVILVGAPGDDDNGSSSGSAYLYNINGSLIKKVKPSDGAAGDNFGYSVAAGSNKIVIGSPGDDDKGNSSGSVYVFDIDGNQQIKITASDGAASDNFGHSVAIGCNVIVVGAPYDDDKGSNSGSVYIFKRDGTLIRKITAPDGAADDNFGWSVSVDLGRIVVGAPYNDLYGSDAGAAYIFDLNGNYLLRLNPAPTGVVPGFNSYTNAAAGDLFGWSVSAGSGRIGVSAPEKRFYPLGNTSATPLAYGLVFLFDLNGTWSAVVLPRSTGRKTRYNSNSITDNYDNPAPGDDNFGNSIGIGSGYLVCGAPYSTIETITNAGSAYIYSCRTRSGETNFPPTVFDLAYADKYLLSLYPNSSTLFPNTALTSTDYFGYSVSCKWDVIVIGSHLENTSRGVDAGAVYVFRIEEKSNGFFEKILDAYGKEE